MGKWENYTFDIEYGYCRGRMLVERQKLGPFGYKYQCRSIAGRNVGAVIEFYWFDLERIKGRGDLSYTSMTIHDYQEGRSC